VAWSIAPIELGDVDEVGRVHVRVWQEAYAGLMPAAYLAALDPVAFADSWRARLADPVDGVRHWLARDVEGIVGITSSGPARDDDPPTPLELYAINVLARGHGTGVAVDLLDHAIGGQAAYLWVLEGNDRALAFYGRHGFADDGGRTFEPDAGGVEIRMARSERTT
jgi:ribosomal protein S18 acetylase RimI-like enzyme